jgi:hypothetical protein
MLGELREVPIKQGSGSRKFGKVFGQGQKAANPVRVGLYARVSTLDQQTLPMQNRAMREYAVRRGWIITLQVKEVGSGASHPCIQINKVHAPRNLRRLSRTAPLSSASF